MIGADMVVGSLVDGVPQVSQLHGSAAASHNTIMQFDTSWQWGYTAVFTTGPAWHATKHHWCLELHRPMSRSSCWDVSIQHKNYYPKRLRWCHLEVAAVLPVLASHRLDPSWMAVPFWACACTERSGSSGLQSTIQR
jgi:hypothetical protein